MKQRHRKPNDWLLENIGEYLRNAGGLFNRIETNSAQVAELKEVCEMYFNLISVFSF